MLAGGIGLAVYLGLGVLYYICGRVALKARIWGPIVVCVFLTLGLLSAVYSGVVAMNNTNDAIAGGVIIGIAVLIGGIFLLITVRGMMAIPKFLASPVWCQEALVNAKL